MELITHTELLKWFDRLLEGFANTKYKSERKVKGDFTKVKHAITSAFVQGKINQNEWNELIDRAIDTKYDVLKQIWIK